MNTIRMNAPFGRDRSSRCPRLLLAEDDAELRALLALTLRSAGFAVVEAQTGAEILGRLSTAWIDPTPPDPIDLIVSDHHMPGLTGLEALAALREIDDSTPVVMITAYADAATRLEAMRLGASLLDKPFDVDLLVAVIRSLLPPSP